MMEPHATIAAWEGDKLTVWTSNQMIAWGSARHRRDARHPDGEGPARSRPTSAAASAASCSSARDAVLAALGARGGGPAGEGGAAAAADHRTTPRTGRRRSSASASARRADGKITAIAHESWSGNLPGGKPETAVAQTKLLYAGANRLTAMRLAVLDLPEGNAMRAPGEAPGMMALEIAMDEMAEKLGIDPIEFRILNDTQVDPEKPERPFSQRHLVECLRTGRRALRLEPSATRSPASVATGAGWSAWAWPPASATTC